MNAVLHISFQVGTRMVFVFFGRLWLRISRLRMDGWVGISVSALGIGIRDDKVRESQSAVFGSASSVLCCARFASSVGGAQITQINISLAFKRVRSDRSSVTFGLNTGPS